METPPFQILFANKLPRNMEIRKIKRDNGLEE
jgi:hypothetical protein